jgi:hypothetical protein
VLRQLKKNNKLNLYGVHSQIFFVAPMGSKAFFAIICHYWVCVALQFRKLHFSAPIEVESENYATCAAQATCTLHMKNSSKGIPFPPSQAKAADVYTFC